MADKKRNYGQISKGMKLTIVVEHALNDVLVVVLKHGSRHFRGVLLDSDKRNLPPGICTAFHDPGGKGKDVQKGNTVVNGPDHSGDNEVDMSATVYRHTYNQSLAQFGAQFPGPPARTFPRLSGTRTARSIRLRPRQTMCSKCKATCLESEKGPVPVNSSTKPATRQNQPNIVTPALPPTSRHSVLNSGGIGSKRRHTVDSSQKPKPTKLIKISNTAKLTKTSPFIKISIGESTVMNIPPRVHESDKEEMSSEEKLTDVEDNIVSIESHIDEIDDEVTKPDGTFLGHRQKRSLRKSKERKNSSDENKQKEGNSSNHHKKHKKSKHRRKEIHEKLHERDNTTTSIIITENVDSEENDDKSENVEPEHIELVRPRPRLLYTWRQNKGLSPRPESYSSERLRSTNPLSPQHENNSSAVDSSDGAYSHSETNKNADSQNTNVERKEYRLRSRSRSVDSNPEYEITEDSAYVSYEDPKSVSDRSEGCSTEGDTSSETDSSDYEDGPPGEEGTVETFRPLMMKIHTDTVTKCVTSDGRKIQTGDIVWGKIKGFPWWPGRILSIAISRRDNGVVLRQQAQIAWFGSSTMSHIQCSDLYPFLEDFKLRYKRKKRGPYKTAIKQATIAAQSCNPHSDLDLQEILS